MRNIFTALLLLLAATCMAKSIRLTVGPLQHDHEAYPVVIYLSDYPELSPMDRQQLGVFVAGQEIPSQLDDLNGDGTPDELAFLLDIKQGEKVKISIKPTTAHKEFPQEVHAEMYLKSKEPQAGYTFCEAEGKQFYITPVTEQTFYPGEDSYHSMHHHGVAFESALMAYRIYFDKKQTIDVYAKKTPRLEIDECKWYPTDEQLARGFGDDILRVSGTIGVGACKPFNGEKMIHIDDVEARTERIVSQGAIRTICEIEDKGWKMADGHRINMITRYTLYARHRDALVEVFFSEPVENMCTGVQAVGKTNFFQAWPTRYVKDGDFNPPTTCPTGALAASWGTAFPVNDSIKYGKETVGLAVYVPELDFRAFTTDPRNNLILLQPGQYIRYYLTVVSQKEQNPPVRTDEEFWPWLYQWAASLAE